MSLTTRILPASEWPLLKGTLLEQTWPLLTPEDTRIVVVEDGTQILACVSLFRRWHCEGAWVAPLARKRVSVGRALLRAVRALFLRERVDEVFTMAVTPEATRLSQRLGRATALVCDHFAVYVGRA